MVVKNVELKKAAVKKVMDEDAKKQIGKAIQKNAKGLSKAVTEKGKGDICLEIPKVKLDEAQKLIVVKKLTRMYGKQDNGKDEFMNKLFKKVDVNSMEICVDHRDPWTVCALYVKGKMVGMGGAKRREMDFKKAEVKGKQKWDNPNESRGGDIALKRAVESMFLLVHNI